MKFKAHVGFRRDNGRLVGGELTDEHDTPTVLAWTGKGEHRVRVDTTNPFEIEIQGMENDAVGTYRVLIHDLTKALAIAVRLAPQVGEAIERDMPNMKMLK